MKKNDKMTDKLSKYHFHTERVKDEIRVKGGWARVAAQLNTSVRTLERTVTNRTRNGRLQRDLIAVLGRRPQTLGYFAPAKP